jgi:predicted 3-demethylubiquinone-9 3-methyltransferase (glyoxalase superfamily)
MQRIVPYLWFDSKAAEAAELYCSVLPDSAIRSSSSLSGTPSGEVDILSVRLAGQEMTLMSAGPFFPFNPSVSFLVSCEAAAEVDRIVSRLGDSGGELMPLGAYPFSDRYVWITDRFGLSWQVMLAGKKRPIRRIMPTQMFVGAQCGRAEEALRLYAGVFKGSRIAGISRYGPGAEPNGPELVDHGAFALGEEAFALMDSAYPHDFAFNEAISYSVPCDTQEEIDYYWAALSAQPEAERCGWLKDRFGFSWQVVPRDMDSLLGPAGSPERERAIKAMLGLKKL